MMMDPAVIALTTGNDLLLPLSCSSKSEMVIQGVAV
jgi:hypothetical protein